MNFQLDERISDPTPMLMSQLHITPTDSASYYTFTVVIFFSMFNRILNVQNSVPNLLLPTQNSESVLILERSDGTLCNFML